MKKSKLLALLLAATMIMGSFAGCGDTSAEPTTGDTKTEATEEKKEEKKEEKSETADSGKEKVLNLSTSSVVVGLNPILNTTAPDNSAHGKVCAPLVKSVGDEATNTTSIAPYAAESYDVSEDGLTYTFHIRENAKWDDGVALTANDFEYTLKLMADPTSGSANAWLFDGVIENFGDSIYSRNNITPADIGVKVIDEHTLEVKLVHPASYFLELLSSLYPVRQDKYEEFGDAYGSSVEKTVFSGPFQMEYWSQNTEMIFTPNPHFWGEVKLDKIDQRIIQESATAVQAFLNGELHMTGTSDPNWQQMLEASGLAKKVVVPDSAPEFLMFNLENEFLSNTKIRQALSIAFDREALVNDIINGNAQGIYSVMPDTMMIGNSAYHDLVNDQNYFVKQLQAENPDPKALLIEGLKELGKGEDPSVMTIRYASRGTSEFSKKMAEWYKQTWETNLGINVQIDMMEWNIMWDRINAGDYDIAVGGWGPYYNEPSAILTLFDPVNGYFNADKIGWTGPDAERFTELFEKAKDITDVNELAQTYLEAEELLVKNAVVAPEYLSNSPTYVGNAVEGYPITTMGSIDWAVVDLAE